MSNTTPDTALSEVARVDMEAPDFLARATTGEVHLSTLRGDWVVLFSHPADFTPVCTSEIAAFARAEKDFIKLDCKLIGLSVDSLYSHLTWIKDIEQHFDVSVNFPIVEDTSLAISRAYGMIDGNSQSTNTVRSVYYIDPQGIIRALVHYPNTVGRSVDEILRVLTALQEVAKTNHSTPEGWRPGEALLLTPPDSQADINKTPDGELWYYKETKGTSK